MENNNSKSGLMLYLQSVCSITSGHQRHYYETMLAGAKSVTCTPLAEVFTEEEVEVIRQALRPRQKECYRNAHLMTLYFPDVEYVEGYSDFGVGVPIEHAFNRRGEQYFDITAELAVGHSVEGHDYLSIGEWDGDAINEVTLETGTYGDIFRNLYIKNHHGTTESND